MEHTTNLIGIEKSAAEAIATQLTELLAEYNVFANNVRAHHWNVRGPQFIALHGLFEEIYKEAIDQIDEIAERIAMMGHIPMHSMSAYLATAQMTETKYLTHPDACIMHTAHALRYILEMLRETTCMAAELEDEGTVAMVSDLISKHEKQIWILESSTS